MALKFLKRGDSVVKARQQDQVQREEREKSRNKPFRYFVPKGGKAKISFLDGNLGPDGTLASNVVAGYEHNLQIGGKWGNFFACTKDNEAHCPLCADGSQAYLAYYFTIIDHTPYTDRNNVTHKHVKKLFVCKGITFDLLELYAQKRGGLAGCTFDVVRTNDNKSPSVGSAFDFDKKRAITDFAVISKDDPNFILPFDYEELIDYKTADELVARGLGKGASMQGSYINQFQEPERRPANVVGAGDTDPSTFKAPIDDFDMDGGTEVAQSVGGGDDFEEDF